MSKAHRRRAEKIHEAYAEHPLLAPLEVIETRLKRHGSLLRTGFIVVLAVAAVSLWARKYVGDPMDRLGYEWLIPQVVPSGDGLPAVAIDFKTRFKKADGNTDCTALDGLVAAVSKLGARAVVVDYDFGIDKDRHFNDGGDIIAQRTWQKSPKPPLYLASLSVGLPKDYWLNGGNPAYAVHPFLPSDARTGQVDLIGDLQVGTEPAMPGMMDTLAQLGPQHPPSRLMRIIATEEVQDDVVPTYVGNTHVVTKEYLFNPATLDLVQKDAVDASTLPLDKLPRSKIDARIAIIGSSTDPTDLHGRSDKMGPKVSGLYMLTAGVAAFSGERLYVFNLPTRIVLDLASGLAIVAVVQWVIRRKIHDKREVAIERIAQLAAIAAAIIVVVLGFTLARALNVLWTDFLLVALVAAFHPMIDRVVHAMKHRKKISIDQIVFKQEETETS